MDPTFDKKKKGGGEINDILFHSKKDLSSLKLSYDQDQGEGGRDHAAVGGPRLLLREEGNAARRGQSAATIQQVLLYKTETIKSKNKLSIKQRLR